MKAAEGQSEKSMNKTISPGNSLKFESKNDLAFIVNFHNEVRRHFQKETSRINGELEEGVSLSEQEKADLETRKELISSTFEHYLRINTFLMMVSHLEEWLFHTWKQHAPTTELLETKGSIGRFKPVLKEIGMDLSRSRPWMFVKGCQDIRSCLLHANGRVSLNRNPDRIRNFVAQHDDEIKIEDDRLVLTGEFLKNFQKAVEQLIEAGGLLKD